MEIKIGQSIGKYQVVEPLGQGGMATVFKGFDSQLERDVAIKLIRLEHFGPAIVDKMRLRFEREAKTLARLTHPNIVSIIDYGEFEGIPFLVMPYLQGGTFKKLLGKPMPVDEAAALLTPIADALAYAHHKGIVHRDVKPANIMFTETGQPMLTDFGIVRLLESGDGVTLTGTGMGIGTPEYMSPEQGLGHEVDGRTDIYSLGTVLYELITGQKPYTAVTPMEIVLKQSTIPLKKPSLVVPEISEDVDQVLLKAMAKEPDDRYSTMNEFEKALESFRRNGEVSRPKEKIPAFPVNEPVERTTDYFVTEVAPEHAKVPPEIPLVSEKAMTKNARVKKKIAWWIPVVGVLAIALIVGAVVLLTNNSILSNLGLSNNSSLSGGNPTQVATRQNILTDNIPNSTPVPEVTREPFVPPSETLRINLTSYPDTLDPQKASWVNEIAHLRLIYEGLTRLNSNLETIPGAAEDWAINEDGTKITFRLRQNLFYSDGALLNAKRFEYVILRNMDPAVNSPFSSITDDIIGAYEYRTADINNLSNEQIAALRDSVAVYARDTQGNPCSDYDQVDCLMLEIDTKYPSPSLPTILSLQIAYPAREELINSGGEDWWKNPQNQIGNGVFIMDTLEENSVAHFRANPNYWGNYAKVNIEYYYMTDTAQAFEAYKNGQVDIINLAAEDLAAARADPVLSKEISINPGYCTFALMMNETKAPFNDPKIREAFSYGLNRDFYVQDILAGLGSPTLTWIPRGFPGFDDTANQWAFDPEKAKQAISESSFGSPQNLPEIAITFSDNSRNQARFQKLADFYNSILGLRINLNPMDGTSLSSIISNPETAPQMYISGWCADYPDPRDWLSFYWKSGSYGSRIGYSNPEVDNLLEKADSILATDERMMYYSEAQRMIIADAPAVFIYNSVNAYLIKPYVKNIAASSMDGSWAGIMAADQIIIQK